MANWGDNSFQEETKFAHAKREMEDCKERGKGKKQIDNAKKQRKNSQRKNECVSVIVN